MRRRPSRVGTGVVLNVHVEELLLDRESGDPRETAAAVQVALGDYFARTGVTYELAHGGWTGSIDLGTLDQAKRTQELRSRTP